jgi:phage protein|nr:MAG TPA: Protein of unknown function (DUF1642) [Bacteriophage sp.]
MNKAPVTIPEKVANFITRQKNEGKNFFSSLENLQYELEILMWITKDDNEDKFLQAWVNGFKVEEAKKYLVKLKNNDEAIDYLVKTEMHGYRFFSNLYTQHREHTRKELKEAGFEWVFTCPGIEIEEVN